jgi:hypothetical protein
LVPPQTMFLRSQATGLQGMRDRFWLSQQQKRIDRDIRRYGWGAAPLHLPQDRAPRCIHSVGFSETLNQPELILFDTPADIILQELNFAFDALRREQLELVDGAAWLDEDGQPRCVLRKVHPDQIARWLGLAAERRRRTQGDSSGLEAFQLVLADRQGFLPWQADYDSEARTWQPALWEPPR